MKVKYISIFLLIFLSFFQEQLLSKEERFFESSARWIKSENKVLCLLASFEGVIMKNQVLVLDLNEKHYSKYTIPDFVVTYQGILPFDDKFKEIYLSGHFSEDYDFHIVRLNPFFMKNSIQKVLTFERKSSSNWFPYINCMDIYNSRLFILDSPVKDIEEKFGKLISYDFKTKSYKTLSDSVVSENFVMFENGNLYFLSSKGIECINVSEKEKALFANFPFMGDPKKEGIETINTTTKNIFISQDEKYGIIIEESIFLFSSKKDSSLTISLFDILEGEMKGTRNWDDDKIIKSILFDPNSNNLIISTFSSIEKYNTNLEKIKTIAHFGGKIVSCGEQGYILFKIETNKEQNMVTEDIQVIYKFLLYNWDGELLYKFTPVKEE